MYLCYDDHHHFICDDKGQIMKVCLSCYLVLQNQVTRQAHLCDPWPDPYIPDIFVYHIMYWIMKRVSLWHVMIYCTILCHAIISCLHVNTHQFVPFISDAGGQSGSQIKSYRMYTPPRKQRPIESSLFRNWSFLVFVIKAITHIHMS